MIANIPSASLPPYPPEATCPSLVIVVSRGHLKAYQFDDTQSSGLRQVDEVEFYGPYDWHPPAATDEERKAVIVAEEPITSPPPPESETELGALRRIAIAVGHLLRVYQPVSWWYAAPGDIHDLVLELLDEPSRAHITCQVRSDLTDVPSRKLKPHFDQVPRHAALRQPD